MTEPYADAAAMYWQAGWRGILPLPPKSKRLTLKGYTGHTGEDPSFADVQAWCDGDESAGNIALRLPADVIGIDVDAYGGKHGLATLDARQDDWGALPSTWRSSARDEPSGIYWYRVPAGLAWPGEIGPHVELIQRGHRYAVVWPSVHPDTGTRYQWFNPAGEAQPYVVPTAAEFAELPAEWVHGLSTGVYTHEKKDHAANLNAWIREHNHAAPCRTVRHAQTEIAAQFRHGSRHTALTAGALRLVRLGEQGHRGLGTALGELQHEFERAAGDPTRPAARTDAALDGEWTRALDGAVALVRGQPSSSVAPGSCMCDQPVSALVPPPELDDGRPRPKPALSGPPPPEQPAPGVDTPAGPADPAPGNTAPAIADDGYFDLVMHKQRINRAVKSALDAEEHASQFRVPPFRSSLSENLLDPVPEIRYTIPELMPAGCNVLLAAQFKAGKTTVLNNVVRSLADHEPLFGKFQPAHMAGRIAIFNYEVEEAMYVRWLRETSIEQTSQVTLLTLRGYSLPLTSPKIMDWTVEWLKRHEIEFWIVDPFARAFVGCGDNENDNMQVAKFLDTLDIIKERAGVSGLILATHTGRAEMSEGAERSRGATRLDDWADVRWLLTTDIAERRYMRATGRDVDVPESVLSYDHGTRQLSIGSGNRAVTRNAAIQDAVLAIVRSTPGISVNALRTAVRELNGKTGSDAITEAIGVLKRAGKLRADLDGQSVRHYLTSPDTL